MIQSGNLGHYLAGIHPNKDRPFTPCQVYPENKIHVNDSSAFMVIYICIGLQSHVPFDCEHLLPANNDLLFGLKDGAGPLDLF